MLYFRGTVIWFFNCRKLLKHANGDKHSFKKPEIIVTGRFKTLRKP